MMTPQMNADDGYSYRGYEGAQQQYETPHAPSGQERMYDDEFVDSLAQRLSQRMSQNAAGKVYAQPNKKSSNQRFVLAMISVIMIALMGAIVMASGSGFLGLVGAAVLSFIIFLVNAVFYNSPNHN
ncbi:hypothetical protein EPA93_07820 [Ktedonosporobacter rubrisoli]|uniref:Uncharacterized protein n=1 Tax=Ktedonosporobacter rubrisoli TaxID=2509675 RepID=A0A4V0YYE3_KTERU|nr:hypothetical protein [Ktedonosporobacter rubrisoli]QBD75921.1 hypothetical protein EPA93_07820 [Ktedonosporobacter rubrisoli]